MAAMLFGCASTQSQPVESVVTSARADQMTFAAEYQEKGIAFSGIVQSKGIKPSTRTGIEISGTGWGVVGRSRRENVNYGYVFLGQGGADDKRALCLFEPEELKQAAALAVGKPATLTGLFSKFVGDPARPTPVFWGCSVVE